MSINALMTGIPLNLQLLQL